MTVPRWTLLLALPLIGGLGCSSKLETGYQPRALGSSAAERRGYYASPFTPEASAAPQSQNDEVRNLRRPNQQRYR